VRGGDRGHALLLNPPFCFRRYGGRGETDDEDECEQNRLTEVTP
jgi:hypothetical protein